MKAVFILSLIFVSTFAPAALVVVTDDPDLWMKQIQAKEDTITKDIEKLRARTYEQLDQPALNSIKSEMKKINLQLREMNNEIQSKSDQKFVHGASDQWLSVLQRAKSLQDVNRVSLIDLESIVKK